MAKPQVNHSTALALLIVNIFLPGVGTIIAGVVDAMGCNSGAVVKGILQMLLAPIIIGWVWCKLRLFPVYMHLLGRLFVEGEVRL